MAIKQMEQQTLPIFAEPEKKVFLRGFLIKVLNSYAAMYIKNLRALSMKKPTSEQISEFVLFASPCYWLLALIFIALVIWKVGFNQPDLIPLAWVSIAIIVSAIFLVKKYHWVSLPMVLLGVYIFLRYKITSISGISFSFMGFI